MSSAIFEKFGTNPPHCCTYCDYRHDGSCSSEEIFSSYDTEDCPNFKLGTCFRCSVYLSNQGPDDNICPAYVDYEGCSNFKG